MRIDTRIMDTRELTDFVTDCPDLPAVFVKAHSDGRKLVYVDLGPMAGVKTGDYHDDTVIAPQKILLVMKDYLVVKDAGSGCRNGDVEGAYIYPMQGAMGFTFSPKKN
jgi:hypothetical protein